MKQLKNRFEASVLVLIVTFVIALAVFSQLSSPVSSGVTTLSNTSGFGQNCQQTVNGFVYFNGSCYNTWNSGTQSLMTNTPVLATLAYWLIPFILLLFIVRRVM